MRSIERRFNRFEAERQFVGSVLNFARAIKGQNFSKERIRKMFSSLVDKSDYEKEDKRAILRFMYSISKALEVYRKQG